MKMNAGNPSSPLILDKAGNLYGTIVEGGAYGEGVVYELVGDKGKWTLKWLHSFGTSAGETPAQGTGSLHPVAIETAAEATKLSEPSMERVAWRLRERAGRNVSER
jgi:hypothetical protein